MIFVLSTMINRHFGLIIRLYFFSNDQASKSKWEAFSIWIATEMEPRETGMFPAHSFFFPREKTAEKMPQVWFYTGNLLAKLAKFRDATGFYLDAFLPAHRNFCLQGCSHEKLTISFCPRVFGKIFFRRFRLEKTCAKTQVKLWWSLPVFFFCFLS